MEPTREKFSPAYDELPEVSQPPPNINDNSPQPREPAGKILTFDEADKEVAWNNMVSPILPSYTAGSSDGPIVVGECSNAETTSTDAAGDATELPAKTEDGIKDIENQENKDNSKLICGMVPKTFWFIVILAIVVVAAAIGGGVGGGIAAAQGRTVAPLEIASNGTSTGGSDNDGSSGNATTTIISTTVSTASSSITTSPSTTSFGTVNSSGETFSFQAFEKDNFAGNATSVIRALGVVDMPFNATSYVWHRNGTQCCTTFCIGRAWVGWWCQDKTQTSASKPFDNIEIGCSEEESESYSKAKCATDL